MKHDNWDFDESGINLEIDPCPVCGNESIFNVESSYFEQYVQDSDGSYYQDDLGRVSVDYVGCGNMDCGTILFERE